MPDGAGSGCQRTGSGTAVSGDTSIIRAMRSVPDTPSTMAWWVLESRAQWPSSRPSTTHISQRGFDRSSAWDMTRPTSLRSSASPPGEGRAVWRRWYSMLKWGSSTHTGRPNSNGTCRTTRRYRGTSASLLSIIATMSAKGGSGPSKIPTDAMCMWLTSSSMCRKDMSSGLIRSTLMWTPSCAPARPLAKDPRLLRRRLDRPRRSPCSLSHAGRHRRPCRPDR